MASGYDGTVKINTELNTSAFTSGIKTMTTGIKSLVTAMGVAFSVAKLIEFGKEAVELASDIAEVQNVVDTAFGDMSYKMEAFAKTSVENFGMSALSAKEMGSTFMAMAKGMGQASDIASDMAIEMTARLGDISSFYNKTLSEVNTIGRAVYSGETEPLKQIGVIMTETQLKAFALSKGYKTLYTDMSAEEKLLVRQQYFLEQTSLASGDFVKTQDSWANQTKVLEERWKEFMSVLGSGLITVLTPVVKMLNTVVATLTNVANTIGKILTDVFGINMQNIAEQTSEASTSYDDLADSAEDYGDAVSESSKKTKGALSSFDSLEVLTSSSDSDSSASSGNGTSSISSVISDDTQEAVEDGDNAFTELETKLQGFIDKLKELFELFKKGFSDGFKALNTSVDFSNILDDLKSIRDTLLEIFTDSDVLASANKFANAIIYNFGLITASVVDIGTTIAKNFLGGLADYLNGNKERIKEYIIAMFDVGTRIADLFGQFFVAIANIFSVWGETNGIRFTSALMGSIADGFMGITELVVNLLADLLELVMEPIIQLQEPLQEAFDWILDILADVMEFVKELIDILVDNINELYEEHISPFIGQVTELLTAVGELILSILNDYILPCINWITSNVLPAILPIANDIMKILKNVLGVVIDVVKDVIKYFTGFITFLTGVFTGDWSKALDGIKTILQAFLDLGKDIIKFALSTIKALIKLELDVIVAVIKTVLISIRDFTKNILDKLVELVKSFWTLVKSILSAIKDFIKSVIDSIAEKVNSFVTTARTNISGFLTGIKTAWIDTWTNIKNKTSDIFTSMWNAIKNVINSILGGVEKMANGVVDGINSMIDALNGLSFSIPDWVPSDLAGKTFGLSLDHINSISIPRLANGAVIQGGSPFLAMLGDQPSGQTNIETPLETMISAFKSALSDSSVNRGSQSIVLNIDGEELARLTLDDYMNEATRQGYNLSIE